MRAALELFEQLEIEYIPSSEAQRRGPRSTCCGNVVNRLTLKHGIEHATIVLRTIVESHGNEGELIADVIGAISDLVRVHPRSVNLGLAFIEAFDRQLGPSTQDREGHGRATAARRDHDVAVRRVGEDPRPKQTA